VTEKEGLMRRSPVIVLVVLLLSAGAVPAAAQPGAPDVWPAQATLDLTHAEPAAVAAAFDRQPPRLFEFVRDAVAHEVYTGALRGPRGTLLAMAGNSVDKALLLAGVLQQAGQRVRYARGTLADDRARVLVEALFAPRPRAVAAATPTAPALKAAADAMLDGLQRDFALVTAQLRAAGVTPAGGVVPRDTLLREAREHYWVQWWSDGRWVDLDPSFRDAVPGRAFTRAEETPDAVPERLFHRVEIRVQLEEQTATQTARRLLLSHAARAADLSGVDLVLIHRPENWTGPLRSFQEALASGVAATGRLKPVLVTGAATWTGGAPFYARPPRATGMEGVSVLLRGAGTRHAVSIATMETVEIDFISPGGGRETVVREVFDLVGPGRRAAAKGLSEEELKQRSEDQARNLAADVYSFFFLTGGIDTRHAGSTAADTAPPEPRAALRRFGAAFAVVSDGVLGRLDRADGTVVRFYPDSPRLLVVELAQRAGRQRLALDLRRDHARVAASRPEAATVRSAMVARGVVDGVLERALTEWVAASLHGEQTPWTVRVSTSALFARARAEGVPVLVLPRDTARLDASVPDDARARLRADTDRGYVAIAPQRAVTAGGTPRFGWWRVDPRTGTTVAVTDDGLHSSTVEYHLVRDDEGRVYIMVIDRANPTGPMPVIRILSLDQLFEVIRILMSLGIGRGMTFLN
jgi:hypothetical protein